MKGEAKDQRIPVMMTTDFVLKIDVYRHRNMIATRAEAVRRLIGNALAHEVPSHTPEMKTATD